MQDNQKRPTDSRLNGTLRFNGGRVIGDRVRQTKREVEETLTFRSEPREATDTVPRPGPL